MGGITLQRARALRVAGIEHLFALGNAERAEDRGGSCIHDSRSFAISLNSGSAGA
jgi:hypothetical protein